jgi:hypothetical protein
MRPASSAGAHASGDSRPSSGCSPGRSSRPRLGPEEPRVRSAWATCSTARSPHLAVSSTTARSRGRAPTSTTSWSSPPASGSWTRSTIEVVSSGVASVFSGSGPGSSLRDVTSRPWPMRRNGSEPELRAPWPTTFRCGQRCASWVPTGPGSPVPSRSTASSSPGPPRSAGGCKHPDPSERPIGRPWRSSSQPLSRPIERERRRHEAAGALRARGSARRFGPQQREEDDVADGGDLGHKHHQPVDAYPDPRRRG